ncbi:MAG: tRNA pseudouridine(38-40) synthase TruA [Verrucomicrobia bacterium]|nr:tRNA pseudouridine(38-40) synthase TruA [Verrucomicrobiota bacterium]
MADTDENRRRFLLTLAYDGRLLEGWQSQAGGNTVQDSLLRALQKVCAEIVGVHGAGRTDAGVSAIGQRAHFDAPADTSLNCDNWLQASNANLPPQIRVVKCEAVDQEFHARFDALEKTYRYRIYLGPVLPPLEVGLAWHVKSGLDRVRLKAAANLFVGRHDFRAFSANRGDGRDETRNAVRNIHSVELVESEDQPIIDLRFIGEGFLYKMVRFLAGTAVRCAQDKLSNREIERLLAGVEFSEKAPFCAPADGLLLEEVVYPGNKSSMSSSSSA